jgi:hypothetical protein
MLKLVKEKPMVKQSNYALFKTAMKTLENINYTLPGLYVKNNCGTELYYSKKETYGYDNDGRNQKIKSEFITLEDRTSCNNEETQENIRQMRHQLMSYNEGFIAILSNTSSGGIRKIYNFSRSIAHCLRPDDTLNSDRVGLLLFYKGVTSNFDKVNSSVYNKAINEWGHVTSIMDSLYNKEKDLIRHNQDWYDYFMGPEINSANYPSLSAIKNLQ